MKAWWCRTIKNSDLDSVNRETGAPRFLLLIGSLAVAGLIWLNW